MTKKRYFKRMWEEEYYIFDSQAISENEFDEKLEYEGYIAFEDSMQGDEVVNRLNELHEENENLKDVNVQCCNDYSAMRRDVLRYKEENEQLKQFKDTTFVLINEMIETANLYRTPIKSLHYGDDLGYWNGVYQKLKELKEILFEKGDVE